MCVADRAQQGREGREAMKARSRFGDQAFLEEPAATDRRVKLFKELSRLGRSRPPEAEESPDLWRRRLDPGARPLRAHVRRDE
jgi:hypothetical protein